jgi:MoaA/NifB/PqqE/SkfB family radical SAM enzyme
VDDLGKMMKDYSKASWVDPNLNWRPRPVSDLPERVLIDFATRCNLRCPMCPVWGSDDNQSIASVKGIMPEGSIGPMLDEMAPAKPLAQPSMYGEPLLIPDLRARIIDMKSRGMTVAMNTNGLTLNDDLAKFFVSVGVDSVSFSLEGVTRETLMKIRGIDKIEKIESAVFRLLAARGDNDLPRIGVSMVKQDANSHEEEAFAMRWAGIVDCVRIGLIFENGTYPGMMTPPTRLPCPVLYHTMPVHNDGTVTICCLDGFRDTDVGNVFESGVKEVWQGEAFAKVRYYHETGQWDKAPFCKSCNGWAQHEFVDEVQDGLLIRRSPQFVYYNRIDRLGNWRGALRGGHPAPSLITESTRESIATK